MNGKPASGVFRMIRAARADRHVMEASRIVSAIDDRSAISAYNLLRTRVLQRMRSNGWRSILVTSPGAGEGKTLTASNLAVSLARDVNQSVLLVDLDLQRSSIAKYFGFDVDIRSGMSDYLLDKCQVEDILYVPSDLERIAIIPNLTTLQSSSELVNSPRMKSLLSAVREQPDNTIAIFDMPPVLACDDVLAFCPQVDAVLLVVAQGQTDRIALDKTMELLSEANLLGVVLNKSDESSGEYYGYY